MMLKKTSTGSKILLILFPLLLFFLLRFPFIWNCLIQPASQMQKQLFELVTKGHPEGDTWMAPPDYAALPTDEDRKQVVSEFRTHNWVRENNPAYLLAPLKQDYLANKAFLMQPDTGLIRLLPSETYKVRTSSHSRSSVRGYAPHDGSMYSFAGRQHGVQGSDIELTEGCFHSGSSGDDKGIFVALGDLPLDSVSQSTPGTSFLFACRRHEFYAHTENHLQKEGFDYLSRLPARAGTTYALRSFTRSDVLVAFRCLRQDTDGSMILLWKMLRPVR